MLLPHSPTGSTKIGPIRHVRALSKLLEVFWKCSLNASTRTPAWGDVRTSENGASQSLPLAKRSSSTTNTGRNCSQPYCRLSGCQQRAPRSPHRAVPAPHPSRPSPTRSRGPSHTPRYPRAAQWDGRRVPGRAPCPEPCPKFLSGTQGELRAEAPARFPNSASGCREQSGKGAGWSAGLW